MSKKTRHYSHWYLLAFRGLFLILLGIYAIFQPQPALVKFAKIFEVFTMASGLLLIQNALLNRQNRNWQFVMFNGLLDLFFGIMLWIVPQLSFLDLKIVLAIWFLYSGLIQAVDSLILIHEQIDNWWFELISGMLSIILAFIIIAVRVRMQKEIYILVGIFAVIFGIFLSISSFFLKGSEKE